MNRHEFTVGTLVAAVVAAGGVLGLSTARAGLTESDAAAGVRAAMERGALSAVKLLGRQDGFLGNPAVRIPLPGHLSGAAKLLRSLGQGRKVDELITAMNRAAESAMPQAQALLVSAVKAVSLEDALKIVRGGSTSVTDFFANKTRVPLGEKFLPIMTKATEKVALAERYNAVAGRAAGLGLIKGDDTNIQRFVTSRALDGLYLMIGEEEKKLRADPVKTGSELLKKVFGK